MKSTILMTRLEELDKILQYILLLRSFKNWTTASAGTVHKGPY